MPEMWQTVEIWFETLFLRPPKKFIPAVQNKQTLQSLSARISGITCLHEPQAKPLTATPSDSHDDRDRQWSPLVTLHVFLRHFISPSREGPRVQPRMNFRYLLFEVTSPNAPILLCFHLKSRVPEWHQPCHRTTGSWEDARTAESSHDVAHLLLTIFFIAQLWLCIFYALLPPPPSLFPLEHNDYCSVLSEL